jgi:hypothetical protein
MPPPLTIPSPHGPPSHDSRGAVVVVTSRGVGVWIVRGRCKNKIVVGGILRGANVKGGFWGGGGGEENKGTPRNTNQNHDHPQGGGPASPTHI